MCHNCTNPHCIRSGCREQTKIIKPPVEPDYTGTFPAEEYLKRRETGLESTSDPESEGYDIHRDAAMLESLIHMQKKVRTVEEEPQSLPWKRFADNKPNSEASVIIYEDPLPVLGSWVENKFTPDFTLHGYSPEPDDFWCYTHEFIPLIQHLLPK